MSQSRNPETPADLLQSMLKSGFAAGFSHPTRVLLNRASLFPTVKETIVKSLPYLLKGLPINVLRGGSAIGLQDYTKDIVNHHTQGSSPALKTLLGITATSLAGVAVACTIETALIRKTIINNAEQGTLPLWRITPMQPVLYGGREVGFIVIMFYSDHLPDYQKYPLQLGGACYTGMMHKFAAIEATRDLLPGNITRPDFAKDGFVKTVSAIANGEYNHESMRVKYKNPDNLAKKTYNFFSAACGMRMFVFRCAYLGFFKCGMKLANEFQNDRLNKNKI